jgi:hypothetical protein
MKKGVNGFISSSSMLFLALIACISSSTQPDANAPVPVTGDEVAAVGESTSNPVPEHVDIPGELPAERSSHAGDYDSSLTADKKRAPDGDRFTFGRFERPFNASTMDIYYPYLDIQDTLFYQDDTWFFAVITLKGQDANAKLPGRYGVEIDLDLDGGGEWLVFVDGPSSKDWSTNGVEAWFDTNNDAGGGKTMIADEPPPGGNGFETRMTDDPDLVWARISPQDGNTVQLAAKRSLLAGDNAFLAGMWAGGSALDPAQFDLNDHMTHAQAGTALVELQNFYPIKELSELDNTCRMAIGFVPGGEEPGLCRVVVTPEEQESCPANLIYCINFGNQTVCYCLQ